MLAIQNIKNIDKVFTGVSKVLKEQGRLILVLNHPAFRVPQFSDWGFDEKRKMQYRGVYKYMSERQVEIDMNPGKKIKNKNWIINNCGVLKTGREPVFFYEINK